MTFNGGARRFAPGAVIRAGLGITWQYLFQFVAIVIAVVLPTAVLTALAKVLLLSGVQPGSNGAIDLAHNGAAIIFLLVTSLFGMAAYLLTQAAIVAGTLQAMQGRKVMIGACLGQALSHASRLLPAGLLLFFGGGALVGIVAFVIVQTLGNGTPELKATLGVYSLAVMAIAFAVITMVWVFVPAIVVERLGPIAGLKRSIALTKGRRWRVAGIVLLLFAANVLASALTRWVAENGAPFGGTALNVIAALFFMALGAAISAVGYMHLRAEKEGSAADLRVFD